MTHAFAPYLAAGYFNSTAVANYAFIAYSFILTAVALPVFGGAKDFFTEKTFLFGLESAVVDGLGLLDLSLGPFPDLIRRS